MKKLILILVIGITILAGCSSASEEDSTKVTKAEFETLEVGMTTEAVFALIGEGELTVESGVKGEALHTVAYQYVGKGTTGANVQLMFQGDKLINKAQAGLK